LLFKKEQRPYTLFPLLLTFKGQDAKTENPFCSCSFTGTDYPSFQPKLGPIDIGLRGEPS